MRATTPTSDEWLRMADVVEINDLDALEHYRLAWNSLLPGTPRASLFHTYDWLVAQWKHYAEGDRRYRVLVVRSAGTVIGIVPLCIRSETYQVGPVRVLTYPLDDWGSWYGPIGPNQAATMRVAARHLAETPRDWELLELRWIDAAPADRAATTAALRSAGLPARMSPFETTSVLHLPASWDEYLASRDGKWRHEIRRQLRIVERLGQVQFIRHRPASAACGDGDPRWDLFDECRQVAAASWQGKSTTGNTITHARVRDFLGECHEVAARLGMVDMALLRVDGRPAAFAYNYHHGGVVAGLRMGYDKNISCCGLGRALLARLIQDGCQRGDQKIDLGVGEYDFKRRFRTHVEQNSRVTHYPPLALRSQGVRLSRWLKSRWSDLPEGKQTPRRAERPVV